MSYDLDMYFEPPVPRARMLRYFGTRKHYRIEDNDAVYQNADTGINFS
ncbi:MAG TPA: hypothetical protein VMT22_03730 [Terriglobales bacterium]|nr:hypothetical protein [Terriglobales bacterium]